jgi:hypothetical protein
VRRRINTLGCSLPDAKIKLTAAGLAKQVDRAFVAQDDWQYDLKGFIEHNNPDNVAIFLGIIGCELRCNAWLERAEIRGWEWPEWAYVHDAVIAR